MQKGSAVEIIDGKVFNILCLLLFLFCLVSVGGCSKKSKEEKGAFQASDIKEEKRAATLASFFEKKEGRKDKYVFSMAPVQASAPSLIELAEQLSPDLYNRVSETGRFHMKPFSQGNQSQNETETPAFWDITHPDWSQYRFHELGDVDILGVPTLVQGEDYLAVILNFYDLRNERALKDSLRCVCVKTGNTGYLAYHLAEKVRDRCPIIAEITDICADGSLFIDMGRRDGIRIGDMFEGLGNRILNADGITIGYMPGAFRFRVEKVDAATAVVKVAGAAEEKIEKGFVLKSLSLIEMADKTQKPRIVITPFRNLTQESEHNDLCQGFSSTLHTELGNLEGLSVPERDYGLEEILKEQKRNTSVLFNQQTVAIQGNFVSTQNWIVIGEMFGNNKKGFRLIVSLSNPETGERQSGMTLERKDPFEFFDAMGDLAKAIQRIVAPQCALSSSASSKGKITADVMLLKRVPSSVLHLLPKVDKSLVAYTLVNTGDIPEKVRVTTKIDEWCAPLEDIVLIGPREKKVVCHNPGISPKYIDSLKEAKTVNVRLKVDSQTQGETDWEEIIAQTESIILHPIDVMCWRVEDAFGKGIDLTLPKTLMAAWINPDTPILSAVIRKAKESNPEVGLAGYITSKMGTIAGLEKAADNTKEQVRALAETLAKEYNIRYVHQPRTDAFSILDAQRIMPPKDAIQYKSANCIDGVILMASLMFRLGIDPVIILRPNHAYLGWWTVPRKYLSLIGEKERQKSISFLETTTISKGFDLALEQGRKNAVNDGIDFIMSDAAEKERGILFAEGYIVMQDDEEMSPIEIFDIKTLKEKKKIGAVPAAI
ncbi:MAG: hypothetical protein JXA79_12880 [Deltaproteobacteria bacterium]|nr:hypothetical protein [Deltaproteobacteria bacterium]